MFAGLLWLLSQVLLPFVAGMALAYLLDPLARLGERFGISRGISALIVLTVVIVAIVFAVMAAAPMIVTQTAAFIDELPGYIAKVQSILSDPSRPWLAKIFGGGCPPPAHSPAGRCRRAWASSRHS